MTSPSTKRTVRNKRFQSIRPNAKTTALVFVGVVTLALSFRSSHEPIIGSFGVLGKDARILFVGDMMFDRTIRSIAEKKGYDHLFSCVKDYMTDFDLVVGNLEGPITTQPSLSSGTRPGDANNTSFTFSPEVVASLVRHNVRAVSIGNNHIFDFGRKGIESTMIQLSQAGVLHVGSPIGNKIATTTEGDVKIALVSYNQFIGEDKPNETVSAIWKVRKENDLVAVYAHWGNEYEAATEYQKALAHRFVDAGADLVIGSHPHVVQEHEVYKGKHIFYSLGNFIFDQYWEESVRQGAGVEVEVSGEGVRVSQKSFEISRDGRTCLR